jgi:AsmA protein
MTPALKRAAFVIAITAGAVVAIMAMALWLVSRDDMRKAVADQIRLASGLDLTIAGETQVSIFPFGAVHFQNVSLRSDQHEPALTIEGLTASLRLLPLLLQRIEISHITLMRPYMTVVRSGEATNWAEIGDRLKEALRPSADRHISFSEIRIIDGVLRYEDAGRDIIEKLSGIELSLAWPSIARSFGATGQFDWRGERVDGSLSFGDFLSALSGDRTSLKLRLSSPALKIAFDGAMARQPNLIVEGTLNSDSPSLRQALRWTGRAPPGTSGFGRFGLKARASLSGNGMTLSNVVTELDGNSAEGVMTLLTDGRRALQGTLAAEALDLSPYVATFRMLTESTRDWNRQPFDLGLLSDYDLDFRLSAARVTVGTTRLGRTAIAANIRNGVSNLSIGEAQVFGGVLKGSLAIAGSGSNADVKAQVHFADINLEPAASELMGIRNLAGQGDLSLTIDSSGSSIHGLTQTMAGTALFTGHDGALTGINVEQLLRRLERRPLSGTGDFRGGRTPFQTLRVPIQIAQGIATVDNATLDGPAVRLLLNGTTSIPNREFDLKGTASLVAASDTAPAFELPFIINGPWDDALVLPDPESLIRRSPASAPLLDAVRERRARDSVRATIERLMGASRAPTAGPPDTAPGAPPASNAEPPKSGADD